MSDAYMFVIGFLSLVCTIFTYQNILNIFHSHTLSHKNEKLLVTVFLQRSGCLLANRSERKRHAVNWVSVLAHRKLELWTNGQFLATALNGDPIEACHETSALRRVSLSDENKTRNHGNPFFHDETMEKWFSFLADRFRNRYARCVFCFLSLTSCILTSAPCRVHHSVLGQVHPIILCPFTALSILFHIYSPERQSSVLDVICWLCGMLRVGLNTLPLSKGTLTAVIFFSGSLWFGFNLLDKGCEV